MTRAPRAMACSARSRTRIPAPSPRTKPSRSGAKGREAVRGSVLRIDSALMAPKAATVIGWRAASVPPATTTSARPSAMRSAPWAMASAPEAQAETGAWIPPRAPSSIPTAAAGALGMRAGTAVGRTRRGPLSLRVSHASMTDRTGPIPGDTDTARRCAASCGAPACSQAWRAASSAHWLARSRRRSWRGGSRSAGSTAKGAPIRTGRS